MIQITAQMRILLAVEAVDFRKGIDGLAAVCRRTLAEDPCSGCLFVFRNRRATSIRILVYDGQGMWLCQKRLSHGRFSAWPEAASDRLLILAAHELQLLLWNGDPALHPIAPLWKRLPVAG